MSYLTRDAVVNFFVDPCIRWDDVAQVSELLCWFMFDVVNGDVGWSTLFSEDRLVNYLSLPETVLNAKQLRGVRKARCDVLQNLFCVGDEGSVVRKKKVLV